MLKDLFKDKDTDKISKDDIRDALNDKLSKVDIEEGLNDLVDLGAISEQKNPKTKQKDIKLTDAKDKLAEPKLLPIL